MTENTKELTKNNHILQAEFQDDQELNENECVETNTSEESQSTEIKSDITSTKSNISEDNDDSEEEIIPDNISLSLSTFQEENDKLKLNIETLELIVSQQQKKINDCETKLHELEQKYGTSEKIRLDLENRLQTVVL